MAKFKYSMQNVLDLKQKMEEAAKMEFMEATARVNEEERKLDVLKEEKRVYEAEGHRLRSDEIHILDLKKNAEALSILQEKIEQQNERLKDALEFQQQKRLQLQHAMQERKTQDKLYENAFEAFVHEENAKESKEVDELVSYVYGQRTKEQGES